MNIEKILEMLNPLGNPKDEIKNYVRNKIRSIIFSIIVIVFVVVVVCIATFRKGDASSVSRPESGSEKIDVVASNGEQEITVPVILKEKSLSGDEIYDALYAAADYLDQAILGDNEEVTCVTKDLNFIDGIPGCDVELSYSSEFPEIISDNGKVHPENVTDDKETMVTIYIDMSYMGKSILHYFYAVVPRVKKDASAAFADRIQAAINKTDEENRYNASFILPETVNGEKISYTYPKDNTWVGIAILGALVLAVLIVFYDSKIKEKLKVRNEQIMIDYPEIITKFTMLLSAGMTGKTAFTRMAEDYRKSGRKRYAYDEIVRLSNEFDVGVPEIKAYQNFGNRMRQLSYSRMVTIIVQNLQKGTKSIIPLLALEAEESLSQRRENAKRHAGEAGTKLLIPMGGLLIVVLVMIMVPAFSNLAV